MHFYHSLFRAGTILQTAFVFPKFSFLFRVSNIHTVFPGNGHDSSRAYTEYSGLQ